MTLRGAPRLLTPLLVTGLKAWHLRPASRFYPKRQFEATLAALPPGAQLILVAGEIDCREGLPGAVQKGRHDSLEAAIAAAVAVYVGVLSGLAARGFEVFVHPPPPVLDVTRHIVAPFCAALRSAVLAAAAARPGAGGRLHWLDLYEALLAPGGGALADGLTLDGTHLAPAYVAHLDDALQRL